MEPLHSSLGCAACNARPQTKTLILEDALFVDQTSRLCIDYFNCSQTFQGIKGQMYICSAISDNSRHVIFTNYHEHDWQTSTNL